MLPRTLAIGVLILFTPALVRADAFDNYTNPILAKVPEAKSVEKITKLTPEMMLATRALPGVSATFIVVKTNDDRWAKLLVMPARQKISDKESLPIVLIDRYVTFREGEERKIHASGQNVRLFGDFRFNLDMGQVVPKEVTADLRVVVDCKDDYYLEPIGKAEMYLVTKHLPEANPAKPAKLVIGAKFETRYFNGAYTLYDDGRRSGALHLKVDAKGDIVGHYYSAKDGAKYEVGGKVGSTPQHQVEFTITYPRTLQTFTGYLFTGDGRAITGSSVLEGRTTGFYAVRIEDEAKEPRTK